jgi:hypothetical protein
MDLTTKTAALAIGIVFVVVGLLGFVNNPIIGLFATNTAHNLVHLVSGILILIGAFTAIGAGTTLKVFGVVYALVAILGAVTWCWATSPTTLPIPGCTWYSRS